jgi:hypothetical protein
VFPFQDENFSTAGFYVFALLRDCDVFYSAADRKKFGGFRIILKQNNANGATGESRKTFSKFMLLHSKLPFF